MIGDFKETVNSFVKHQQDSLTKIESLANKIGKFTCLKFSSSSEVDLEKLKFSRVLYFITLDKDEEISGSEIYERINQKKEEDKELKLPKTNKSNAIDSNRLLYVGKSFYDFSTRMKQHLGLGSEKVYALHLNKWKKIFDKEIKLNLCYISLEKLINKDEDHVLELLESAIHFKLKPILGRTGH